MVQRLPMKGEPRRSARIKAAEKLVSDTESPPANIRNNRAKKGTKGPSVREVSAKSSTGVAVEHYDNPTPPTISGAVVVVLISLLVVVIAAIAHKRWGIVQLNKILAGRECITQDKMGELQRKGCWKEIPELDYGDLNN